MAEAHRIVRITLDERTVIRRSPDIEHERKVAIYDLLEANHFRLIDGPQGPYCLHLGMVETRLMIDIRDAEERPVDCVGLALMPFRRVVKDYFTVCESYYQAIKTASPSQIEAIDMGRRALHNEGSALLRERLAAQVEIDDDTARRLFTLLCVLQIRG